MKRANRYYDFIEFTTSSNPSLDCLNIHSHRYDVNRMLNSLTKVCASCNPPPKEITTWQDARKAFVDYIAEHFRQSEWRVMAA